MRKLFIFPYDGSSLMGDHEMVFARWRAAVIGKDKQFAHTKITNP